LGDSVEEVVLLGFASLAFEDSAAFGGLRNGLPEIDSFEVVLCVAVDEVGELG
jgi:hypothetical protein